MRFIPSDELTFVPAGHENPTAPGVWKKVLFAKDDLFEGRIQMVNWAKLPAGNRFAAHYHEDMQEIFVMMTGQVRLTIDGLNMEMGPGDAVLIDACEIHAMHNAGDQDAEYLAVGIAGAAHGRTVVVDQ